MAVTVEASGTQAASIGTEHTLGAALTGAKVYILHVNTKNMVLGDTLELRAYKKVLTGDANGALVYSATYAHVQGDAAAPGSSAAGEVVKASIPIASAYSLTFTLKQTAGTGRSFDWNQVSI